MELLFEITMHLSCMHIVLLGTTYWTSYGGTYTYNKKHGAWKLVIFFFPENYFKQETDL